MEFSKDLFCPATGKHTSSPRRTAPRSSAFRDAMHRFAKNKASVAAAVILGALLLFALLTPLFAPYGVGFRDGYYRTMPPYFARYTDLSGPQALRDYHSAMGVESGQHVLRRLEKADTAERAYYRLTVDAYAKVGYQYVDLTPAEFAALQDYQNKTHLQVCYPLPENYATFYPAVSSSANLWYQLADEGVYSTGESAYHDESGTPLFFPNYLHAPDDGSYRSLRLADDPGTWVYGAKNQTGYRCRVLYSAYYTYQNGVKPSIPMTGRASPRERLAPKRINLFVRVSTYSFPRIHWLVFFWSRRKPTVLSKAAAKDCVNTMGFPGRSWAVPFSRLKNCLP